MEYILKHKNIDVLSFDTDGNGNVSSVKEIYNIEHCPIHLLDYKTSKNIALYEFWKRRSIPASRQNIERALEQLGETASSLVLKSFGLSLSDCYWAKPSNSNLEWKDINFYENTFSDDVGNILFNNANVSKNPNLVSPDNTSDGWLKKRWVIRDGERVLIKAGSEPYQQEPFNEVLASKIYQELGLNHVPYKAVKIGDVFYSACPCFTSLTSELIPAWPVFNIAKRGNSTSMFNHLIDCAQKLGLQDSETLKQDICRMLLIDYITANTDRHLNNFGFLRNPDTLELTGLAPIYDSGTSMFYDKAVYDLKNIIAHDSSKIEAKPFAGNQKEQLRRIPYKEYCKDMNIDKLKDIPSFYDKLLDNNPRTTDDRRHLLCTILDNRIHETKRLIKKALQRGISYER